MVDFRQRRFSSPIYGLLGLMIVALGLRLVGIGRESLWFDEAVSYLTADLPLPLILNNSVQSSHPPFYYVLLSGWQRLVPDGDGSLRLLGALWNVALVPIIYGLGRILFPQPKVAWWAAVLVVLSPFHLLYSHELRMYTQLMTLVTAAILAYWQARQTGQWRWWWGGGVLFLMACYTHLFGLLALAGVGLYALLVGQERRALWRTVVMIGVIGVLFAPWLLLVVGETQTELGSLRPLAQASGRNPIKPLLSLAFLIFGLSSNVIYSGVALFLALAGTAVLGLESRKIRRDGVPEGVLFLLIVIACVLGIPLLVYLIRPFFLPERTMAAASPFLLLLVAWFTTRRQSPLAYLAYGTAVVMLFGSLIYLVGPPLKPLYRDVAYFVAAEAAVGDVVLHTSDGSYLPALRYVALPQHVVLADDPDPRKPVSVYGLLGGGVWSLAEVEAGVGENGRLWLIVALEHSVAWQEAQAERLGQRYTVVERYDFEGITVVLYE